MSFLEKKIKENKDFFDNQSMPEGHENRFLERLDVRVNEEVRKEKWPFALRIAATIIILVSGFFVIKSVSVFDLSAAMLSGVTEINLSSEIENIFAYYDNLSQQKVDEIDQMAPNKSEAEKIKQMAEKQLLTLDANLAEIEKEYTKYPDNEMLKAAMVNNKRQKAEIMDNILKQLDQASDPSNNLKHQNNNPSQP